MYASLIKNDGTFGGGQSVDGFGRIENSGLLGSAVSVEYLLQHHLVVIAVGPP